MDIIKYPIQDEVLHVVQLSVFTMPKAKTKPAGRKYQALWEDEYPWVRKDPQGTEQAYCHLCRATLVPKKATLSTHQETEKHKKRAHAAQMSKPLQVDRVPKVDDKVKVAEIELSVCTACHCAIRTIDHLGEIVAKNGKGSILGKVKLHRTKCSKILSEVVSPSLKEELAEDIKGKKYSMFIDESTDVSVTKVLVIAVKYFSLKRGAITTALLSASALVHATGEDLFEAVKKELGEVGLSLHDCIGLSCDGAAANVGVHNSLWSRVKEVSPNCILMKCLCHSLALSIQHAFNRMPSNLGFLLSEVPKFFSQSTLRRESYKSLFQAMNPDGDKKMAAPFESPSTTRWLVRGRVMKSLLHNWEELVKYFSDVEKEGGQEVRCKARIIRAELNNPYTHMYFTFAEPIVSEFERVNVIFQADHVDPEKAVEELERHFQGLCARVCDKNNHPLGLSLVDFGSKFQAEATSYLLKHPGPEAEREVTELKERCLAMLKECVEQVKARLPENKRVFKGLSFLHPSKVLNQFSRATFSQLPMSHLQGDKVGEVEEQYRKICFVNWSEEAFGGKIPEDTVDFWLGVKKFKNAAGKGAFESLADYALACLSMPLSNAVVERIFSTVTSTKTKLRNKLQMPMLDALLRIKTDLYFQKQCCTSFHVTPRMIRHFTSKDMYSWRQKENESGESSAAEEEHSENIYELL